MNKLIFLFGTLLLSTFLNAQSKIDSISMGALYAEEVYYSLQNGVVSNVSQTNWDLAFSTSGQGAAGSAILLNESNTKLWACPTDTASWATFDTTGYQLWNRLLNSDTTWTNGAFNAYRGGSSLFDMGWGILHPQNNYWAFGDSLYLLQLNDNSFKKLWIVSLKTGVWNYKYANLDGTNEQVFSLDKSLYPNKNFVYHSLITDSILDRQPNNNDWDIVFSKHTDFLNPPGMYQNVTSVFSNTNVWTAKAYEADFTAASQSVTPQTPFTKKTDNLGREWKKHNSSTGWQVRDSIAYFLYNQDSTGFYRIVFTSFGGMANGNAQFNIERLGTVSIETLEQNIRFSLYPNPAVNQVTLLLDCAKNQNLELFVYHLSGNLVLSKQLELASGVNQKNIDVSSLNSGMYLLVLKSNNAILTQKLLIK